MSKPVPIPRRAPWLALVSVFVLLVAGGATWLFSTRSPAPDPCDRLALRLDWARALHRHLFATPPAGKSPLLFFQPGFTARSYFALLEKECLKGESILPLVSLSATGVAARVAALAPSNLLWHVVLPSGPRIRAESPYLLSTNLRLARLDGTWEVDLNPTPDWPSSQCFFMVNRGGHASVRPASELSLLRQELNGNPEEVLPP